MTDQTTTTQAPFVNPTSDKFSVKETFHKLYEFMKSLKKKTIITVVSIIVFFAMIVTFFSGATSGLLDWSKAAFSSATSTHIINVGTVHARHTRSLWFVGSPVIKFWNPIVDGTLTYDGKLGFNLDQKNGPKGSVNGTVSIVPPIQRSTTQKYKFMGDGISGSFLISVVDGNTSVQDFNLNINWSLVDK